MTTGPIPAGFHIEHYVDGDLVNADLPVLNYPFGRDTLLQWGPAFPGSDLTRNKLPSSPWLVLSLTAPP